MTILVTGGSGLVGARLLPRLVAAGFECRALLRGDARPPAGVTPVEGDLLSAETLAAAVEGVSAIVHLAALFRTGDEAAIWNVNHQGTRNLIAAAQAHAPTARFVMASTGLVYGQDGVGPGRETDHASPAQAYPASKLAAESDLQASLLNWSILRLAFVYGDNDGHIESVPRLYEMFQWHPAVRLSMVHHQDVAAAVILALRGTFDGRIVNLADDAPTTLHELAVIAGGAIPPSNAPLANPWMGHIDGGLARSLGFKPAVRTVFQASEEGAL
jgi:nucleoside-diphosphate-sugar epimerase